MARTVPLVWHRADSYELATSGPNAGNVEAWPALYANTPSPHKFVRTNDVGPPAPAPSATFNGQAVATFTTSVPRFLSSEPAAFWDFYFNATGWSCLTVCGSPDVQGPSGDVSIVCGVQALATAQRWQITFGEGLSGQQWRAQVFANTMGTTVLNLGADVPARFLLTSCDPARPVGSRVQTRLNNLALLSTSWTQPASSVPGSSMYLGAQAAVDLYRWVGPWAECIWWGRPMAAADVATIRDYLNARYLAGLTWS